MAVTANSNEINPPKHEAEKHESTPATYSFTSPYIVIPVESAPQEDPLSAPPSEDSESTKETDTTTNVTNKPSEGSDGCAVCTILFLIVVLCTVLYDWQSTKMGKLSEQMKQISSTIETLVVADPAGGVGVLESDTKPSGDEALLAAERLLNLWFPKEQV